MAIYIRHAIISILFSYDERKMGMYAYQKKYDVANVHLIYPMTEKLLPEEPVSYRSADGVNVHVEFVDLYDVKNSIDGIVSRMICN